MLLLIMKLHDLKIFRTPFFQTMSSNEDVFDDDEFFDEIDLAPPIEKYRSGYLWVSHLTAQLW